MAFELPDLDTRDSATLQAELVRRIPQFTTRWTDFNDSDPGITILQLLCWIGESLLYQANAIPIQTQQNFLREVLGLAYADNVTPYSDVAKANYDFAFERLRDVLAGVDTQAELTEAALQHAVMNYRADPYLALSCSDVQVLALETNLMIAAQQAQSPSSIAPLLVQRADALVVGEATSVYILSDAKWAYQLPWWPNSTMPDPSGKLRRLLLLQPPSDSAAADAANAQSSLLYSVNTYLAPRVILGNQVNVQAAQLTSINLRVVVRCPPNVGLGVVLDALLAQLFAYFKPDANWVYDQPPVLDNVQLLIENVAGVATLESIDLNYAPTAFMPGYAQLDANCLIADLPQGPPANVYRGLPQLRCLDLYARPVS